MNSSLLKRIAQGMALSGSGAIGYKIGKDVQKKRFNESISRSKQTSALSSKLREQSESANRRLKIENYYIRKALNELAKRQLSEKR